MITVFGKGKSAKALAKTLGIAYNRLGANKIIRYKTADLYHSGITEINTCEAVRKASHKYASLVLMRGAELNVPPFNKDIDCLISSVGRSATILARKNYHTKGQDIIVLKDSKMFDITMQEYTSRREPPRDVSDYYIQYLKPDGEYRYHIAFGKVILPTKKVLADGEEDSSIIRNHQNGKWQQVVCRETERFSHACIKAISAHGLDFGAVDFINIRGVPFMLEVNTAPGLQVQNRLDAYVRAFKENIEDFSN